MRVLLVGAASERARLRARLDAMGLTVVGEFATLAAARAAEKGADAIILAAPALPALPASPGPHALAAVEVLTPREIQVLELLAEGLSNKAIAERLGISAETVKFHVASLSGKLGASNRTDAVRRAIQQGLVSL